VRRTRLIGAQGEPFPGWRHFAFVTNRTEPTSAPARVREDGERILLLPRLDDGRLMSPAKRIGPSEEVPRGLRDGPIRPSRARSGDCC
jgi:hypothetical protein